jgi:hypothetical protein
MKARQNPFRTERVLAVRYRPQAESWDGLLARLEALRWRGAIVGPHGSGKTTLLEDLAPRLRARGFRVRALRLDDRSPALPADTLHGLGSREIVLLDGGEVLGAWAWRRFARKTRAAGGVVATLHRAGRLPTWVECTPTPALLEAIIREVGGAEFAGRAPSLFAEHRGNMRNALRALYDLCAAADVP